MAQKLPFSKKCSGPVHHRAHLHHSVGSVSHSLEDGRSCEINKCTVRPAEMIHDMPPVFAVTRTHHRRSLGFCIFRQSLLCRDDSHWIVTIAPSTPVYNWHPGFSPMITGHRRVRHSTIGACRLTATAIGCDTRGSRRRHDCVKVTFFCMRDLRLEWKHPSCSFTSILL